MSEVAALGVWRWGWPELRGRRGHWRQEAEEQEARGGRGPAWLLGSARKTADAGLVRERVTQA